MAKQEDRDEMKRKILGQTAEVVVSAWWQVTLERAREARRRRRKTRFCLSIPEMFDYIKGKYQGKELDQIQKHIASCPYCRSQEARGRRILETEIVEVPGFYILPKFQKTTYRTAPAVGGRVGVLEAEDKDFAWEVFIRERDLTIVLSIATKREIENLHRNSVVITLPSAHEMVDELTRLRWVWKPNGPEAIVSSKAIDRNGHLEVELATCPFNIQSPEQRLLLEKMFETI